jgi:hypothetical protein
MSTNDTKVTNRQDAERPPINLKALGSLQVANRQHFQLSLVPDKEQIDNTFSCPWFLTRNK